MVAALYSLKIALYYVLLMEHSLNVVRVTGGLGNQLSAYAYARCVAQAKGCVVKLDTTPYQTAKVLGWPMHNGYELSQLFGIEDNASLYDIVRAGGWRYYLRVGVRKVTSRAEVHHSPVYVEPWGERSVFREHFAEPYYSYYHGFFIHHQYFKTCETELRQTFTFAPITDVENLTTQKVIAESNSVAIHVRRADEAEALYGADLAYYERAVARVRSAVPHAHFFIFSNDPVWCAKTLQLEQATYVTHNIGSNAFRDMQLMSQCRHIIMPASTFSFWAGLLKEERAGDIIICPEKWYGAGYSEEQHPAPPEWVRV